MNHNVGTTDSAIRWLLAVAFVAVSLSLPGQSALALLAAVAGLVMVATAMLRTCPLYSLLGINTCPRHPARRHS